jgi:hypothetical protein
MDNQFKFNHLQFSEEKLAEIRNCIYDKKDNGGYYIFKNFLSVEQTSSVVNFWNTTLIPGEKHDVFPGKNFITENSPNYYAKREFPSNLIYYNYLWNKPADDFTHSFSLEIAYLRNIIEGKSVFSDLYPKPNKRCVSYRVVITKNGDNIVEPHRDWVTPPLVDSKRLQATLYLSNYNKDYSGKGFILEDNSGKHNVVGKDILIEKGDLIIWKYNNEHCVQDVKSTSNQIGFARMIFPPVEIQNMNFSKKIMHKIVNIPGVQSKLLPLYKKLR